MEKQITVKIKEVYGNRMIYPACQDAKVFALIAGTKTLTSQKLEMIEALGYDIIVEQTTL